MIAPGDTVWIAGAGPTGAMLALLLERRGLQVRLIEARGDPRTQADPSGRSINLALADRGIEALKRAGVLAEIEPGLIPMRGRFVHPLNAPAHLQPYGRRPGEQIYSISRRRLNATLLGLALRRPGIEVGFEQRLEDLDRSTSEAEVRDLKSGLTRMIPMQPLIAADGAGSIVRRRLAERRLIEAQEQDLEHGYKELSIPPGPGGEYRLEREALHIWPRGGYMLIALPNEDGSFTATLFLPMRGPLSFASLESAAAIDEFLASRFPDAHALMPDAVREFREHPTGFLGTVHASPWNHGARTLLIGDAAHALVPFHGQGMNCCLEDCLELDQCLATGSEWECVFEAFYARRKPNTDAIAEMALENYLEMRERVVDPRFQLQQSLALELERRFPERFIPRYSMVMFHHEIPYRTALERGRVQARLLEELTREAARLEDVDFALAEREIREQLEPLAAAGDAAK
ncbi:MAG TPA: NAD(P)/FAD-dependent oxidoreductase [Steroidobacteraceae bacterium]|nr:NAD(P)/FAD-dependent oxidoreductase [Steroidobacteraceae bacterium]